MVNRNKTETFLNNSKGKVIALILIFSSLCSVFVLKVTQWCESDKVLLANGIVAVGVIFPFSRSGDSVSKVLSPGCVFR